MYCIHSYIILELQQGPAIPVNFSPVCLSCCAVIAIAARY